MVGRRAERELLDRMREAVERGEGGVIRMPFYAKCVPVLGVLPGGVQRVVRWWSGIDRAIVGREKRA